LQDIIDKIRPLDDEDLCFIGNAGAKKYLKNLKKNDNVDFLKDVTNDKKELLEGLLEFNPYFRKSAKECLKNEGFALMNKNNLFNKL